MKKRILAAITMAALSMSVFGCASNTQLSEAVTEASSESSSTTEPEAPFDYLAMDIYEYKYPEEFVLEDDLNAGIWTYVYMRYLALSIGDYDLDDYSSRNYKEDFKLMFIDNDCLGNDYIDNISIRGDGLLTQTQAEYIQYSLTGHYVSFDDVFNGSDYPLDSQSQIIRVRETQIVNMKEEGDKIIADVHLITGSENGIDATVELKKNPYSCFNGYSITDIKMEVEPIE